MRYRPALGLIAGAALLLTACTGDEKELSMCTAYAEFVQAADSAIESVPATGANVAEATEAVSDVRDEAAQLLSVADARYTTQLTTLVDTIDELLATLESAPDDSDYETWLPLVQDSVDNALDADEVVRDLLGPECDLSRVLDEEDNGS